MRIFEDEVLRTKKCETKFCGRRNARQSFADKEKRDKYLRMKICIDKDLCIQSFVMRRNA